MDPEIGSVASSQSGTHTGITARVRSWVDGEIGIESIRKRLHDMGYSTSRVSQLLKVATARLTVSTDVRSSIGGDTSNVMKRPAASMLPPPLPKRVRLRGKQTVAVVNTAQTDASDADQDVSY